MSKELIKEVMEDVMRWIEKELNIGHYPQTDDWAKKAVEFTEVRLCEKLLERFDIESVPSNVDTFEKVVIYIKSQMEEKK